MRRRPRSRSPGDGGSGEVTRYGIDPVIDTNAVRRLIVFEYHGWFGLSETADEADVGGLDARLAELQSILASFNWPSAVAEVRVLNGLHFLSVEGLVNRRRSEARSLDELLAFVATRLPGSWGLLYERGDDMPDPPGANAFRVRVVARGRVTEQADPFLSPCRPTIEN